MVVVLPPSISPSSALSLLPITWIINWQICRLRFYVVMIPDFLCGLLSRLAVEESDDKGWANRTHCNIKTTPSTRANQMQPRRRRHGKQRTTAERRRLPFAFTWLLLIFAKYFCNVLAVRCTCPLHGREETERKTRQTSAKGAKNFVQNSTLLISFYWKV